MRIDSSAVAMNYATGFTQYLVLSTIMTDWSFTSVPRALDSHSLG